MLPITQTLMEKVPLSVPKQFCLISTWRLNCNMGVIDCTNNSRNTTKCMKLPLSARTSFQFGNWMKSAVLRETLFCRQWLCAREFWTGCHQHEARNLLHKMTVQQASAIEVHSISVALGWARSSSLPSLCSRCKTPSFEDGTCPENLFSIFNKWVTPVPDNRLPPDQMANNLKFIQKVQIVVCHVCSISATYSDNSISHTYDLPAPGFKISHA